MTDLRYIRIRPFDVSTEEGRSLERHRRAAWTALVSGLSRGLQLVLVLCVTRVALPYMGSDRFGIWATIYGLTTILTFLDLGIGNSLVGKVARLVASSNEGQLRHVVCQSILILFGVGFIAGSVLLLIARFGPVSWLYRDASAELVREARVGLEVFSILFGLSMPLQAVQRIYSGLQEGYKAAAVSAITCGLSLLLLPWLPSFHASIAGFVVATYGIQLLSGVVLILALWARLGVGLRDMLPLEVAGLRELLAGGGLFFLLQIGVVVGWDMDVLLLSAMIGPSAAGAYSVVQRLFLLVTGPVSLLNAPLWAAYADAHARNDVGFLRTALRRSMLRTLVVVTAGTVLMVAIHAPAVRFLARGTLLIGGGFFVVYGLWAILSSLGEAFAMYLNGMHILRPQVFITFAFLLVALALKLVMVRALGLSGIVMATLIGYLLTVVLMYLTVFRREVFEPLRCA